MTDLSRSQNLILTSSEIDVIKNCVRIFLETNLFAHEYYSTILGCEKSEVRDAFATLELGFLKKKETQPIVNGCMVNVIWYPHEDDEKVWEFVGAEQDEIERVFEKWRLLDLS